MGGSMPEFVSLTPVVVGLDRVLLNLETANFATQSNVFLELEPQQEPSVKGEPPPEDAEPVDLEEIINNSPYPNVELAILDPENREVASLFVVEHKEAFISMIMHLRQPQPGEIYTARAEMIHARESLQVLTIPFKLELPKDDAI